MNARPTTACSGLACGLQHRLAPDAAIAVQSRRPHAFSECLVAKALSRIRRADETIRQPPFLLLQRDFVILRSVRNSFRATKNLFRRQQIVVAKRDSSLPSAAPSTGSGLRLRTGPTVAQNDNVQESLVIVLYHLNISGRRRPRDGGLSRVPPVIEKILLAAKWHRLAITAWQAGEQVSVSCPAKRVLGE